MDARASATALAGAGGAMGQNALDATDVELLLAGLTDAQVFGIETWADRWQHASDEAAAALADAARAAAPATVSRDAPTRAPPDARRAAVISARFDAHPIFRALGQMSGQLATHQLILGPDAHRRLHVPARKLGLLDALVAAMYAEEGAADMVVETLGARFRFGADLDIELTPGIGLVDDRQTLAALLRVAYDAVAAALPVESRQAEALVMIVQYRAPSATATGLKAGLHLSFGDAALVSRDEALRCCASLRAAVGQLFTAEGWRRLEVDASIYNQGLRLPFCRKADGSRPYLPLASVDTGSAPLSPPAIRWLDETDDAGCTVAFLAAARLRSELEEFAPAARARSVARVTHAGPGASRAVAARHATPLVAWLNAKLAEAKGTWPAVHAASATTDASGAPIAICSTHCTHCDLAGRAHAAGRTALYFANRCGLDLCCADPTCVTAHARVGVAMVQVRRFHWREGNDAIELRELLATELRE